MPVNSAKKTRLTRYYPAYSLAGMKKKKRKASPSLHRKSPLTFRPTEYIEGLIARAKAATGKPHNQIINEALSIYLGSPKTAAAMASLGEIKPDMIGEIARRSAHAAELAASIEAPVGPDSYASTSRKTRTGTRTVARASTARRPVKN